MPTSTFPPSFRINKPSEKNEPEETSSGGNADNPGRGGGGGWRFDENVLLAFARRFAKSRGYELDNGFASAFLGAIRSRNVDEDDRHEESEAIEAVRKLVIAAIDHSQGTDVLTADSFFISLSDVCPLWPFCR
jgi:hypothetical protein